MAPMKGSKNKAKLDGKVVVITGANTGIGKETARDLSRRGAKIVMLCRSLDKANEAAEEIRKETKGVVEVEKLDLASLDSVRECAQKILEKEEKIDYLINNAGIMVCPQWKTKDGFDMQIGTNHLGHFLLTEMLRPLVAKAAVDGFRPRIVILSSSAHEYGKMHWDDLNWEKNEYSANGAYCQSKLANVLHAKELARRMKDDGVSVYAVHPGVVDTGLFQHAEKRWYSPLLFPAQKLFFRNALQGAQTTLYCCLEESIAKDSGYYYADCKEKTPQSRARKVEDQKRLWDVSEEMVGLKEEK